MRALLITAVVVALGGAFYFLTPHAAAPTTRTFNLTVVHGALQGEHTLTASQGDTLIFSITADEPEEFHLHGYDRLISLTPGQASTLTVAANQSGHFTFELEQSSRELGSLDVYPR